MNKVTVKDIETMNPAMQLRLLIEDGYLRECHDATLLDNYGVWVNLCAAVAKNYDFYPYSFERSLVSKGDLIMCSTEGFTERKVPSYIKSVAKFNLRAIKGGSKVSEDENRGVIDDGWVPWEDDYHKMDAVKQVKYAFFTETGEESES